MFKLTWQRLGPRYHKHGALALWRHLPSALAWNKMQSLNTVLSILHIRHWRRQLVQLPVQCYRRVCGGQQETQVFRTKNATLLYFFFTIHINNHIFSGNEAYRYVYIYIWSSNRSLYSLRNSVKRFSTPILVALITLFLGQAKRFRENLRFCTDIFYF